MTSPSSRPASDRPASSGPSTSLVVGVLAGAGLTVSAMQTFVVPLTPSLPQLFETSASNASWIITSTLLVAAVATPVIGRLGDMFGKKLMMVICVGFLAFSSAICALATTATWAIIGRGVQGLGIAAIPLGISLMRDTVEPQRLGSAIALMSSSLGAGGALGLPVAAFLADTWGWSVLFWTATGLGLLFLALVVAIVPESPNRVPGRIDVGGIIGLTIGLGSLLIAISKGGDWGWSSSRVLGLLAIAALTLGLWAMWELRVTGPIVDLRTTVRRPVLMCNLASVMVGFSMFAMGLLSSQILQLPEVTGFGRGQSMMAAGLWMAPGGLMMVFVSQVAARLIANKGARCSLLVGVLVMSAGSLLAQALLGVQSPITVVIFSAISTVGVAFAYAAMPTIIMANVDLTETAAANGFNSLARSFGTSLGSAAIGTVVGAMTMSLGPYEVVSEAGVRVALLLSVCSGLAAAAFTLAIPRVASSVAATPQAATTTSSR